MNAQAKTRVLIAFKLAVSAALIAALLARIGVRPLLEVIGQASPGPLVGAALILLASHVLACWQWGRLLGLAGASIPAPRIIGYYFAGTFLNLVLPGGVGGDLARVMGPVREGARGTAVAGATIVDRILGGAALGLLAVAALLLAGSAFGASNGAAAGPLGASPGGTLAVFVLAYGLASVLMLVLIFGPGARRLLRISGRVLPAALSTRLGRLEESLERLGGWRRLLFVATALVIQSVRILAHAQVARALEIDVDLRYFFLFVPLLAVGVSLPVSVGGIGVRETLGAALFGLLGVEAAKASAMQLLGYLLAVGVSLPGAALLMRMRSPARRAEDGVGCR